MARLITNQDTIDKKLPTAKYSSELFKNQHLIQVAVKQLDEFIFQRAAKLQLNTAVQQATVTHSALVRIPFRLSDQYHQIRFDSRRESTLILAVLNI